MKAKSGRQIKLGNLPLGGGAPVLVQSMTNTDTRDKNATLKQINRLAARGCEAVRLAVPDIAACASLRYLVDNASVPLIADIHFDYKLAIKSVEEGMAGLRINPGNIGSVDKIRKVADAAKMHGTVIRIGVNSGSLEPRILSEYRHPLPDALVKSALENVKLLEAAGFHDLKISLKSSSVTDTIEAYRKFAQVCDLPLHLGITEAGGLMRGTIKSAVGMGILLHEGIGDTIRVSLTADPEEEVKVAWEILRSLGLRSRGPEIISCPTCGRTEIDILGMVEKVEKLITDWTSNIKIAVMGCVVNGPGEAREADIGIAGGKDKGIIFRKGKIIKSVRGSEALMNEFLAELQTIKQEKDNYEG